MTENVSQNGFLCAANVDIQQTYQRSGFGPAMAKFIALVSYEGLIGPDYLDLLRFYLNHRVLERSERPERRGKTPAELLTGAAHGHWLELLGFTRFARPA